MLRQTSRRKVRPTLIVGVGGTGTKAVKVTKRLFQSLHPKYSDHPDAQDTMFPFVQFLAIDTDSQPEMGAPLGGDEFLHIGNFNFEQIFEDVRTRRGPYSYINWLPKTQLGQIRRGVGGERRVGRLCYHRARHDVLGSISNKLATLKSTRIDTISRLKYKNIELADESGGIDIHIISSVCGGTGSGFLLNMVYDLSRHTVKETKVPPVVFGHLVLPEPFDPEVPNITKQQNRVNAYICLNEIDYFYHTSRWNERYLDETAKVEEPPFHYCFLLGDQSRDTKKKIGEMVSMISESIGLFSLGVEGEHLIRSLVNMSTRLFVSKTRHLRKLKAYSSYGVSILEIPQQEEDIFNACRHMVMESESKNRGHLQAFLNLYPHFKRQWIENEAKKLIDLYLPDLDKIGQLRGRSTQRRGLFGKKTPDAGNTKADQISAMATQRGNAFDENFSSELSRKDSELSQLYDRFWSKDLAEFIISQKMSYKEVAAFLDDLNMHISTEINDTGEHLLSNEDTIRQSQKKVDTFGGGSRMTDLTGPLKTVHSLKAKNQGLSTYRDNAAAFRTELLHKIENELWEFNKVLSRIKFYTGKSQSDVSVRLPLRDINILSHEGNDAAKELLENFWRQVFSQLFDWKDGFRMQDHTERVLAIRDILHAQVKGLIKVVRSGGMDIINILESREDADTTIDNRFRDAAPAWRVRDNYRTEYLQRNSYLNINPGTDFARRLDRITNGEARPTEQMNAYELSFFRTEHGLALWGLDTLGDYFKEFEKYRRTESKTVEDLQNDPNWAIELVLPNEVKKEEVSRLFSAAWYLGKIIPDRQNVYKYHGEHEISLSKGRFDAYRIFNIEISTREIESYEIETLIENQINILSERNGKADADAIALQRIQLEAEMKFYREVIDKLKATKSNFKSENDIKQVEAEIHVMEDYLAVKSDALSGL